MKDTPAAASKRRSNFTNPPGVYIYLKFRPVFYCFTSPSTAEEITARRHSSKPLNSTPRHQLQIQLLLSLLLLTTTMSNAVRYAQQRRDAERAALDQLENLVPQHYIDAVLPVDPKDTRPAILAKATSNYVATLVNATNNQTTTTTAAAPTNNQTAAQVRPLLSSKRKSY